MSAEVSAQRSCHRVPFHSRIRRRFATEASTTLSEIVVKVLGTKQASVKECLSQVGHWTRDSWQENESLGFRVR